MFKRISMIFVLLVSACTSLSNGQFGGESLTFNGDNILRNDVVQQIKRWERDGFGCQNIDHIQAGISDIKKENNLIRAMEIWTVQACGENHTYHIYLNEHEQGSVNFRVGYRS